jgi:hydroxymethylpyrimidine pyrophosphatase-like HAD family hydrolase
MKYVAIDFDGTIAKHEYPDIGEEVPDAFRVMKILKRLGYGLILYTMRSDTEQEGKPHRSTLTEAAEFCKERGIEFDWINENPEQLNWTDSKKIYASHYIDDNAIGCPLIYPEEGRPYVDWNEVEILFLQKVSR